MPVLPKLGRVAVLTAACAASCLANPYGTAPIAHASEVRAASAGIISEWAPAGFGSLGQRFALAIVVTGVLLGALAFRRHRLASGSILLVLAALSATAVRFAPMAATLIVPELALLVTRLRVRRRIWKVGAALVCVVFVLGVVRHVSSFARLTERDASPGLVARLPRDCRLVNDYSLGGAVILLRPDVKVSVDGRNDLYGKQLVLSMLSLVGNAPGTANRLHAEHVTCVLTFSNSPLVSALAKNPQWRVIGHDSIRTLLVRETQ